MNKFETKKEVKTSEELMNQRVDKQYDKLQKKYNWIYEDDNGQIRDINGVEIKNAIRDVFLAENNKQKEECLEKLQALIDEADDIKRKNESLKDKRKTA